ncbi:glycosyltransferase [Paracoccus caeni]|uniref:Glycosyltransferase n=1 Tax=Paracoccus caeni TaxID=657651 RepID=A0A934SCK1_9RHOB|nr:glycosyltransferase [Paracoccus caeni]MBK4216381.1 glycosyltransferase [Paracoccus caeni]
MQTQPDHNTPALPDQDLPQTVVILLATYRGEDYIDTQLDSIAAQSHPHWRLIVSDDSPDDLTREKVRHFSAGRPAGQVQLIDGPRKGATQNFLHLLQQAPEGQMLAFCDQDDRWLPEKLAHAVKALSSHPGPAHYAARTIVADENLNPITETRHFRRPLTFRNALVQACMAGNTSVFNAPAASILKQGTGSARDAGVISHDWWAYQLTSGAGATMIHDATPALLYRQHPQSEMGRNDTAGAMARRVGMLFAGDYGDWLAANTRALLDSQHLLTSENAATLQGFADALRQRGPGSAASLWRLGLYRQTKIGTAALFAAAGFGRLLRNQP